MRAAATEISVKVKNGTGVKVSVKLKVGGLIKAQINFKNQKHGRKPNMIWQRLGKLADVVTLIMFVNSDYISGLLRAVLVAIPSLAR